MTGALAKKQHVIINAMKSGKELPEESAATQAPISVALSIIACLPASVLWYLAPSG